MNSIVFLLRWCRAVLNQRKNLNHLEYIRCILIACLTGFGLYRVGRIQVKVPFRYLPALFSGVKLAERGITPNWKNDSLNMEIDNFKLVTSPSDQSAGATILEAFFDDEYRLNDIDLSNATVIDVGANIGDVAIQFIRCGAKKVYAFEPVPSTFQYLKRNVLMNKLESKLEIFNYGLCSSNNKFSITIKPYASACASTTSTRNDSRYGLNKETVEVRNILEVIKDLNLDEITVFKCDCEGCEYNIFNKDFFDLINPSYIFVEYHNGSNYLLDLFDKHNYEYQILEKTKLVGIIYARKS
jgi:FkbM family methyltransferase